MADQEIFPNQLRPIHEVLQETSQRYVGTITTSGTTEAIRTHLGATLRQISSTLPSFFLPLPLEVIVFSDNNDPRIMRWGYRVTDPHHHLWDPGYKEWVDWHFPPSSFYI